MQDQINTLGEKLPSELPFEPALAIEALLAKVLPLDDSALRFSPAGVGMSADLDQASAQLFERYVERYTAGGEVPRREDEDSWRTFQGSVAM